MHPTDRDRMMAHADDDEARKREDRERVERQCPPIEPNEAAMTTLTRALDMTIGPVAAKADHIPDLTKMVAPETCKRCGREALTVGGHCGRCIRQIAVGEPAPTLAVCRKCLTLKPNATGFCDGCSRDLVREEPPDVSPRDPGDETT